MSKSISQRRRIAEAVISGRGTVLEIALKSQVSEHYVEKTILW